MYLEVVPLTVQHKQAYRGMVDDLDYNKTMRKKMDFHTPSKSCIWQNVKVPISPLGELLIHASEKATNETLLADSSSYTCSRYVWKENCKGGRFEHLTLKHYVLLALNGCPAAAAVTDWDRDDSPMLTRLTKMAPHGNGYRLRE